MPTPRKVLCVAYAAIAVAALVATGIQNLAYLEEPARYLNFINDLKVTPASRLFAADVLLLGLAVAILMVVEARKHDVKFVWLYIVGGLAIAISVTFPLFLSRANCVWARPKLHAFPRQTQFCSGLSPR